MGNKLTGGGGTEEKKADISSIAEKYYDNNIKGNESDLSESGFYRAICKIVEEVNHLHGNTQLNVPSEEILNTTFEELCPSVDPPTRVGFYFRVGYQQLLNHHKGRKLTKDEFGKCVQRVLREAGFSGYGAKDSLIYIFGVPITALLIKHTVMPRAVSNDYFIPGVTSATALVLAKLNKI